MTVERIDNISMQTSPSVSDINQSDRSTKLSLLTPAGTN